MYDYHCVQLGNQTNRAEHEATVIYMTENSSSKCAFDLLELEGPEQTGVYSRRGRRGEQSARRFRSRRGKSVSQQQGESVNVQRA